LKNYRRTSKKVKGKREIFVEKGNFMTYIQKFESLTMGWEIWKSVEKKCG